MRRSEFEPDPKSMYGYIDVKRGWEREPVLLCHTPNVLSVGVIILDEHTRDSFTVKIARDTTSMRYRQIAVLPFTFSESMSLEAAEELAAKYIADWEEGIPGKPGKQSVVDVARDVSGKHKYGEPMLPDAVEEDYDRTIKWIKSQCLTVPISLLVRLHQRHFK